MNDARTNGTRGTDIRIHRRSGRRNRRISDDPSAARFLPSVYWTWCGECGRYVTYPELQDATDPTRFVCEDCDALGLDGEASRTGAGGDPAAA